MGVATPQMALNVWFRDHPRGGRTGRVGSKAVFGIEVATFRGWFSYESGLLQMISGIFPEHVSDWCAFFNP